MSIFYFLFQWQKQLREEKKAKARAEVRRSPRTKDMKVFYKESSSSEDTKKATMKAEAKTVAGRKFPSPNAQRVRRIYQNSQAHSQENSGFFPWSLAFCSTSLISSMQAFISSAVKRPIHLLAWAKSPQSFFPASVVCHLGDFSSSFYPNPDRFVYDPS